MHNKGCKSVQGVLMSLIDAPRLSAVDLFQLLNFDSQNRWLGSLDAVIAADKVAS